MIHSVDKSGDNIRRMFADIAPRYDLMNHVLSMNIDRWWRARMVRRLRIENESPILDVCTGTGDLAIALARRVAGKAQVIGTDFCDEMLTIASRKAMQLSIPEQALKFQTADTLALPFPNGMFQVVTVAFGIRNVADVDAGIGEMRRVCAPGGQVAILEFSKPRAVVLKQLYSAYFHVLLPRIGQAFSRSRSGAYEYLPASVDQFLSGERMVNRLSNLGLRNVRQFPLTWGVATLYLGDK